MSREKFLAALRLGGDEESLAMNGIHYRGAIYQIELLITTPWVM